MVSPPPGVSSARGSRPAPRQTPGRRPDRARCRWSAGASPSRWNGLNIRSLSWSHDCPARVAHPELDVPVHGAGGHCGRASRRGCSEGRSPGGSQRPARAAPRRRCTRGTSSAMSMRIDSGCVRPLLARATSRRVPPRRASVATDCPVWRRLRSSRLVSSASSRSAGSPRPRRAVPAARRRPCDIETAQSWRHRP